jgi:hypothetical protein
MFLPLGLLGTRKAVRRDDLGAMSPPHL